ncbi:MAG: 6-phospho-beta-glucosidase [Oscillospiraceae bacterium]|nr:6-phospho-beta-glucosidase [Oscillospiraceae bacterium]
MKKLKAAVIGAGSTYTPELIEGFVAYKESLPFSEFALMDIDGERLSIVGNLAKRQLRAGGLDCKTELVTDLDRALDGADFVFGQIRVGKMPARILDEKIPLKYDLLGQETTGAGGFMKALRTVPVIMDITDRMKRFSEKDAWLINFSNPSGIIAEAVLNYTGANMIGLCNVPVNMLRDIEKKHGFADPAYEYVGLNHLSWITSENPYFASYYLDFYEKHDEKINEYKEAGKTRGEVCLELEETLLKQFADESLCIKPEELSQRGGALYSTAALSSVDSIHNDRNEIHVVAAKNNGAVPFMADSDVVEIKCRLGRSGITPLPVKIYNDYIIGLMQAVKAYEKLAVEAALEGSREKALAALIAHPLVDNEKAEPLLAELLEAHREYLPNFFGGF